MRAARIHSHGNPDRLHVENIEQPTPGTGHVLVEVAAAGVNPVDTYFRSGEFEPVGLPFTPGMDVAGTIVETGSHVKEFVCGDEVFGTAIGNSDYQGSYAEFAVVPTDRIVHRPPGVDIIEVGAAGNVAATAWRGLIDLANLRPTETCLIHGASGGVGHVAVQLGTAAGARVIATAAPLYHDAVSSLGADQVVDYNRPDLLEAITALAPQGIDVILDHRLDEYLQFDADVAATGARVVGIGETQPTAAFSTIGSARWSDVSYHFMTLFNIPSLDVPLAAVADLLQRERLRISIHEAYDLDAAGEAHRMVTEESFLGKLVIRP